MEWKGQRVVVIGAARQGIVLARHLAGKGAMVIVNDQRPEQQLQQAQQLLADLPVDWVCGGHPLDLLQNADWVCPSGGVPLTLPIIQEAVQRGIPLTNDSQIFLESAPCRVIGITGSAGKTTTTTLVGRMAEAACSLGDGDIKLRKVWVGGNIGTPLLAMLDQMQPSDLAVMELSSFQLEIMSQSPNVAAVLNITPNHLDRHGDMRAYTAAKRRILDFQSAEDVAVLGKEDPGAWGLASIAPARVWSFGWSDDRKFPGSFLDGEMIRVWDGAQVHDALPKDVVRLRGAHNLLNVLAACAIAGAAGISPKAMLQGVQGFGGVAHRLTFVRSWGGADWYNDSIASAPERAMAAIRSFDESIVLLAGGRDKNLPWENFARLVRQRVDHLVVFGEAAGIITAALDKVADGERPFTLHHCSGLRQAVQTAAQIVQPGDVVLLSPGGTSFDEFRDFEERGEVYTQWVLEL